ncbi:periostin-like isoform X2 [Pecten maximus]|uniref:periostin-like isoform X2 n=1 Tax=Pecten maximus TaxID=6579 RepID=UPI001458747A|nr:periostin-like isoform X2 [Pecten maximus]
MRVLHLVVFVLTILLWEEEVSCGQSYYYFNPYYQSYRKKHLARMRGYHPSKYKNYQRDTSSGFKGPNMCRVKEVFGTGQRFYEGKVPQRRVCDRPTFVRYQCCPGYNMVEGEKGCPAVVPLQNLKQTTLELLQQKFPKLLTNTELEGNLLYQGAFTVFVPIDSAFQNLTYDDRQRLHPWTYHAPSLLHYHVVTGRYNYTTFKKQEEVPTLYYGEKKLRINKYPSGVATVNCARIMVPNQMASNGIVHIIDRLIRPLDFRGTIADVILRDQRLTKFSQMLYKANLIDTLQKSKHFTLFIPEDKAFKRLSSGLNNRITNDRKIATAIAKYHIIKGTYCAASTVLSAQLISLEGGFLAFICKFNGNYVNDAKLIEEDIVTSNGVIHIINKVLLPNTVKDILQVAHELDLTKLTELVHRSGLADWVQSRPEYTWFAPNDAAFEALSPIYKEALQEQPGLVEQMLKYHTLEGRMKTDSLVGEQTLRTGIDARLKVGVYHNGITIDSSHILDGDRESSNGLIHVIDKVLIPPELNLMDLIESDPELEVFTNAIKKAGLEDLFQQKPGKQLTVIAPTTDAFYRMPTYKREDYMKNKEKLKRLIARHVIDRVVVSSGLDMSTTYSLMSRQLEPVAFKLESSGTLWINKYAKVQARDHLALNGVIFKTDRVLHCLCKEIT